MYAEKALALVKEVNHGLEAIPVYNVSNFYIYLQIVRLICYFCVGKISTRCIHGNLTFNR